jgi:hypothetical protein
MTVAVPLVRAALCVEASTVNTTAPAGGIEPPVTVALAVTVSPYTGEMGEKASSAMLAAGAVAGPVSTSCTEFGVESAALERLPFSITVSLVMAYVVGV